MPQKISFYLKNPSSFISSVIHRITNGQDKRTQNEGFCIFCKSETRFIENGTWLRDEYICSRCKTIPRQRAFVHVIERLFPVWRDLEIHESSPDGIPLNYFRNECSKYTASQYYPSKKNGEQVGQFVCQNLECLTYGDSSFDLFLSQDVFEHVLNPESAFKEIARVLRPGGAHIFTMPWYPNLRTTVIRAIDDNGTIKYLEPPVYHGNPVDTSGSLVTRDWGLDFTDFIYRVSGLYTTVYVIRDRSLGIDGEFLEVFVSRKV